MLRLSFRGYGKPLQRFLKMDVALWSRHLKRERLCERIEANGNAHALLREAHATTLGEGQLVFLACERLGLGIVVRVPDRRFQIAFARKSNLVSRWSQTYVP